MKLLGEKYYDKLLNKWWEDYEDEPNVLIDDIGPDCIGAQHVKRWLDKKQFRGEAKFGSVFIRPQIIIFTSNYHPSEIWKNPADYEAILDRVQLVHRIKMKHVDDTISKKAEKLRLAYIKANRSKTPTSDNPLYNDLNQARDDIQIISDDDEEICICGDCFLCRKEGIVNPDNVSQDAQSFNDYDDYNISDIESYDSEQFEHCLDSEDENYIDENGHMNY